jgi:hypothetical protein
MRFIPNLFLASVIIPTVLLAAAASCKKSNNNNSNNNSAALSASVNDTAWANSFPLTATYSVGGQNLQILGEQLKNGDTTGLGVVIYSPILLNAPVSSSNGLIDVEYARSQFIYDGGGNGLNAGHSTVTVTSYDSTGETIAGTFSGVLYNISGGSDSVIVTNGQFKTSFTSQ